MKIFSSIFGGWLRQKDLVIKRRPPEELPPEAMAKVLQEANFLRSSHAVDVRNVADGEDTSTPKPAN